MHWTIYQILRYTGRRLGEIVGVKIGCVEVIVRPVRGHAAHSQ
jgi:hypothetical protein